MRDYGSREGDGGRDGGLDAGIAPGKVTRSERLPPQMQAQFEARTGEDLSDVRVHTGGESAAAAHGMGARAFASGQDIHFGAGQYQPDDPFGMHLIAHEVAHTVQQKHGAASGVQCKGDSGPDEVAADAAADEMVKPADAAFVDFTQKGDWVNADDTLKKLRAFGAVPPELEAAILQSVRMTAVYCIDLRSAVLMAAADPEKKKECERIAAILTSRINELTFATSRSPLQYGQLADVAAWGNTYMSADPKAAPKKEPDPPAAGDPVERHAAKLAGDGTAYVHPDGKKDLYRKDVKPAVAPNSESSGDLADPPLPGYRFIHDPFDNTVVAVRPDGTGTQYTYDAVKTDEGVTLTLAHTEELSALRVGVLARMDKAAMGEKQEDDAGRQARIAADQAEGDKKRAAWEAKNPGVADPYKEEMRQYNALSKEDKKKAKVPVPPQGYPGNPTTTDCPLWCTPAYKAGGGKVADKGEEKIFPFTPPTKWDTFKTLATRPEGPNPGDVYWLYFANGETAHMGVFKSRSPAPDAANGDKQEMWVCTDGGQGGYTSLQLVVERTRGPFNPTTGVFTETSDSGQATGTRKLAGWIDIDEHNAKHTPTAEDAEGDTSI